MKNRLNITDRVNELLKDDPLIAALNAKVGGQLLDRVICDHRYSTEQKLVVSDIFLPSDAPDILDVKDLSTEIWTELDSKVREHAKNASGNAFYGAMKEIVMSRITGVVAAAFKKDGVELVVNYKDPNSGRFEWTQFRFYDHVTPESQRRKAEFAAKRRSDARQAEQAASSGTAERMKAAAAQDAGV